MVIFRDFKPFLCCTFEFLSSYVFGDNQHTMLVAAVAKIFIKSFFFSVCGELAALDILVEAGANASTADVHGAFPIHYSAQMCGSNGGGGGGGGGTANGDTNGLGGGKADLGGGSAADARTGLSGRET